MARGPAARRYARALFDLAAERGRQEEWQAQLRDAATAASEPTVALYLGLPRVPIEDKLDAVRRLLEGYDPLVVNAVQLLTQRRALDALADVAAEYDALLNETMGRVPVSVTSAVALSGPQQTRLSGELGRALRGEVVLDLREDAALLGGLIVQVGDQVIDGSVRTRLDAMRRTLQHQAAGQGGPAGNGEWT